MLCGAFRFSSVRYLQPLGLLNNISLLFRQREFSWINQPCQENQWPLSKEKQYRVWNVTFLILEAIVILARIECEVFIDLPTDQLT